MASFQILEQREEDELHKLRLLNVEEKPFKRITKRLLTPGSLLSAPSKLPTPPPDPAQESSQEIEIQKIADERRQFREDVLLDFAAFDSSIARIQFLQNSNEQERERYRADKERILETAQAVRDSTAQLRIQLEAAKATLEQRKKFDKLAEKITNNKALKPRDEQRINLLKLEEECRELERESLTYGETWKERREQFGRIVEEGMQLRRLIRDEKEEVERREGMDGGEEDGEVGEDSQHGGRTPNYTGGNGTPRPDEHTGDNSNAGLKPRSAVTSVLSRAGSRSNSRAPSPTPTERRMEEDVPAPDENMKVDSVVDTPMAESAEVSETPLVTVDGPVDDDQSDSEGEVPEDETEDKMDTT
ncbi:Tho complex subunit 7-domain-containing protein [Bisporella sp. PMI_857]|nr:Tho complex subunit 7-domain-containing protein [Bisporella sp. PMI_857]